MEVQQLYDVAIAGGGLAGLSCAIQLRKAGHSVILFEKEKYPFHKVCGEYVSMESWNFLEESGLPLNEMDLPRINTLFLTSPNGQSLTTNLPLGGFGISRFVLENKLAGIARENGVVIEENCKVNSISFNELFTISAGSSGIQSRVACAAFGKHSNLDVKWKRKYLEEHDKKLDNYVAVKYHVKTVWPENTIGLHNFQNGYCGISKIEEDKYCLCYMTRADELRKNNNDISQLEQNLLYRNSHLKKIFMNSEIIKDFPVTISQINFNDKTRVEGHVLMLGDAAGMITPLCGNGMSIALHTGKIAAAVTSSYLNGKISRANMETAYELEWKKYFSRRLQTGRFLQRFFGSPQLSNVFVKTFQLFPFLAHAVVKMTHGKPF